MLISVLTGFAAGTIHVVGGADHLVAIAPTAFRRPRLALREGLAWGIGHSAGVVLLSVLTIFLKDLAHVERMSGFAEFTVGIALLIAGVFAIKTAFGLKIHTHPHYHSKGENHQHMHLHVQGRKKHSRHSHASTSLGVLHGLAGGSHLLAVVPALALPPLGAFIYIFSYLLGSVFAMAAVVLAMSLATLRAGNKALPTLIGLTGTFSILLGCFWVQKTTNYIF